jgi:N-acetylglucosamine kinase-like BadF-type ATPase
MKYYLGIDNGTSGTIALVDGDGVVSFFMETPVKIEQSYTKTKQDRCSETHGNSLNIQGLGHPCCD